MLLVLAPQPRLDRVQFVERLDERERQSEVYAAHFEAGGPGIVALRTARSLGLPAKQLAFRGAAPGAILADCCLAEGLDVVWTAAELPTAMATVLCGCDSFGAMTRRSAVENPARVVDGELRAYVESFEREVQDASSVLFVDPAPRGALGVVLVELMRRCRARGKPFAVLGSGCFDEVLERAPTILVDRARGAAEERAPCLRDGMEAWMWVSPSGAVSLLLEDVLLELDLPESPDRGGEAPFEAGLVAWLSKRADDWPVRTAACWGMAASTAQRLKEFGGRVSAADVDGFFAQVRARETGAVPS